VVSEAKVFTQGRTKFIFVQETLKDEFWPRVGQRFFVQETFKDEFRPRVGQRFFGSINFYDESR
jgi:hypothetical protein